jgi:hypothetical protein
MPEIPRRIIQTWKTRDLPLVAQAAAQGIRLLNPSFEYVLFDDANVANFIDKTFPQYRDIFEGFAYKIQKFDFFRYLAVYHFGGFYFDLDVLLAKDISELCSAGCVFPFEELTVQRFLVDRYEMDWEIGNYAFGAAPGSPFLAAVIENCVKAQRDPAWPATMWGSIPGPFRDAYYVFDTTGPGLVTRTLAEFPDAAEHVKVLFPADVCDSSTWHQFGDYGVHLQQGEWRSRKGFLMRKLGAVWETRERAAQLRRSQARGPTRSLNFRRLPE